MWYYKIKYNKRRHTALNKYMNSFVKYFTVGYKQTTILYLKIKRSKH